MRQALLAPGAADASGGLQEMCQALLAPGVVDASGVSNLQLTQCRLSSLAGSDHYVPSLSRTVRQPTLQQKQCVHPEIRKQFSVSQELLS